jgi:pyruvate-formate lyase-activating enzyme
MFAALHADRSGRIVLARDRGAAVFDGQATRLLGRTIPLPDGALVEPLVDRIALGIDRTGVARALGAGRWAVGASLPAGYIRLAHPAYVADEVPARPGRFAALGADERGDLVVAAEAIDPEDRSADGRPESALPSRIADGLRERPSSRLVRQLARCAKDYRCRAAANAFLRRADMAVPIAAPVNELPPDGIAVRAQPDATPTELAGFEPTPLEIADLAVAHLEAGGTMVAFGQACEGEPLLAPRTIDLAIAQIRERTALGSIHLETNGSVPSALHRLAEAGLDSIAIRLASARSETYERLHGPRGYRFTDVRASIDAAIGAKLSLSIVVLIMPGLSDRERELDAIVSLCGALPPGSQVLLRDLVADPAAVVRVIGAGEPLGVERLLARLRSELPSLRLGTVARPLARV